MTLAAAKNVFPLPLTTFENYMLADDGADYPMTLIRQLLVSGRIRKAAFESAIRHALNKHPLLSALTDRSHTPRPHWTQVDSATFAANWADIRDPLLKHSQEFIDLMCQPGLRIWVRQADAAAVITLQFHHACCDGTGAMQFIADLLAAYAREIQPEATGANPTIKPRTDLLKLRDDFFSNQEDPSKQVRVHWSRKMVKAARFFFRKATPLLPPREAGSSPSAPSAFPHVFSRVMGRSEVEQLKRSAKQCGATLNDWLLRDLFQVVRAWNRENASGSAGRWLRITMPVNLRTERHQAVPAANIMSYGFVTRDEKTCDDSPQFLDGIVHETREIKYGGSALMFLKGAAMTLRIPGAVNRMASREKCYATVVLSNVGDVTARLAGDLPREDGRVTAGDIVLESVRGCPPPRRNTNVVFHVMTYAGRMTLATRADERVFRQDDAREILSRFVRQLRDSSNRGRQPTQQDDSDEQPIERWEDIAASWHGGVT